MNIIETGLGKIIETDVPILGAGAAGSGAAIAARREGVDVVLVEKCKLESCGSAGGGNDHFTAALNAGPETDACEAVADFFGKPISGWTAAMIENGGFKVIPVILDILEQEGVKFRRNVEDCPGLILVMTEKGPDVRYADECWHCGNGRTSCPDAAVSHEFPLYTLV